MIARGRQRRDSVALVTEGSQMDLSLILWSRDNYVVKGLLLTIMNLGERVPCRLPVVWLPLEVSWFVDPAMSIPSDNTGRAFGFSGVLTCFLSLSCRLRSSQSWALLLLSTL